MALDPRADKCPAPIHQHTTPPPCFRFLDLPGELQNHIVEYFIVSSHPLTIHQPRFNRHPSPPPKPRERPRFDRPVPLTPPLSRSTSVDSTKSSKAELGHTRLALMLTCRRLYREHWRTYYGQNKFEFNRETFSAFLEQIPPRCIAQIRRISFRMPHKHHHDCIWSMLAGLKRLEELDLWLCPPSQAEDIEYETAKEGAKSCKRLLHFSLQRCEPDDEESKLCEKMDEVREKDREVEEDIVKYLQEREEKRRRQSRSRSRPVRNPRDGEFPMIDSLV